MCGLWKDIYHLESNCYVDIYFVTHIFVTHGMQYGNTPNLSARGAQYWIVVLDFRGVSLFGDFPQVYCVLKLGRLNVDTWHL